MMQDDKMSLVEHLTELRKRLMWIVGILVLSMIGGFIAAVKVLDYLKSIPPASTISWNALSPGDGIRVYMQLAFLLALIVTLPFILYHVWAFVKPGLRVKEQKATLKYIPFSVLLFLIGLLFSYSVVFRMALNFTTKLNKSMNLQETYGISQYFSFMFNIILPVALLFELPVVVMFLTKLRILNPKRMSKIRRYAYMVLVVLSTLIAPPDLISNILIVIPMIILYEISVVMSRMIYRKQLEKDKAWEADYGPK